MFYVARYKLWPYILLGYKISKVDVLLPLQEKRSVYNAMFSQAHST